VPIAARQSRQGANSFRRGIVDQEAGPTTAATVEVTIWLPLVVVTLLLTALICDVPPLTAVVEALAFMRV